MNRQRYQLYRGKEFDILEYRPGKFMKIQEGEIVGRPTEEEIAAMVFTSQIGNVDPGIIQISLAVTALSALVSQADINIGLRITGSIAFILGALSSAFSYFTYILQLFPRIQLLVTASKWGAGALIPYYIRLFARQIPNSRMRDHHVFSVLTTLVALTLLLLALTIWMIDSYFDIL